MKKSTSSRDVYMRDGVLASFEYGSAEGINVSDAMAGRNEDRFGLMMERLRNNPDLALELLSYDGPIIYMGTHARQHDGEGRTLGMRFTDEGFSLVGDNMYGRFLTEVRSAYARELSAVRIDERLPAPGQIIVDHVPAGAAESHVESMERMGADYIHVEPYRPVSFRRDTSLDGTTGHSRRQSDREVGFHTFECPFGTERRYKVMVGSAAEASFLYEKGLRGEINWEQLFRDLRKRGLSKLPKDEEKNMIMELSGQFAWMREQIARDRSLKSRPIVADLLLVPDASFGRSIHDYQLAPSPAHVLARYINNPLLLFTSSENGVLRALENKEKDERCRFSPVNAKKVTIVIDGSDTIGGRVPGTRALSAKDRRRNKTMYELPMKSKEEIDADYAAFSARMNDILSNLSDNVKVEFVTGNRRHGLGEMLRRFVVEHDGVISEWDYNRNLARKSPGGDPESRFSMVRMPKFDNVFPVLAGLERKVSFLLDDTNEDTEVTFSSEDGLRASAFLEYSVSEDQYNRNYLQRGSQVLSSGYSLIHIQDNAVESLQASNLRYGSVRSLNAFSGGEDFKDSLFDGQMRTEWDLASSSVLSYVDHDLGVAVPNVAMLQNQEDVVYVANIPYHSVLGIYAALLMKESGVEDVEAYSSLSANEDSLKYVFEVIDKCPVSELLQEKCMRNAAHLMAQSSSSFTDMLLSTGESDIVMMSTFGGGVLFTDMNGKGENRFGIVLQSERQSIMAEVQEERIRSEQDAEQIARENARLQKKVGSQRARGEKMTGGLPSGIEDSRGAVWFLGTASPVQLCLPDDSPSFLQWEQTGRFDGLSRELASRPFLEDGDGSKVPNRLVFLFPTDLLAVTGRRVVRNSPASRNLTGLSRINPDTGREFTCAYGIPVKRDNKAYEFDNKLGMSSSFRLDRESSDFVNSVVAADAQARTTAINQDMSLCYAVSARRHRDGGEDDDISRVFSDEIYDFPRTKEVIDRRTGRTVSEGGVILPTEVRKRVYDKSEKKYVMQTKEEYRKEWIRNPHAAPRLRGIVKRYESMLVNGACFPLNCICMPRKDYNGVNEEVFLSDFTLALSVANATAVALNVPMRFPLDKDGRLDLGPDIPEHFLVAAERKLDSFIRVVRKDDIVNSSFDYIRRIPIHASVRKDTPLKEEGRSDIYLRPNDLLTTFGMYDFDAVLGGQNVPIHEMAFTTDDGVLFRVTDPRLTRNMTEGEKNRYLRYSKNDECRFTVKSSDPDRIPDFISALRSYIAHAKQIKVESRLLTEKEADRQNLSLEGFVSMLGTVQSSDRSYIDASSFVLEDGTEMSHLVQFSYTQKDGSRSEVYTVNVPDAGQAGIFNSALDSFLLKEGGSDPVVRVLDEKTAKEHEKALNKGFFNLLSSNSDQLASGEQDISSRGPMTGIDAGSPFSDRFMGKEEVSEYYGKEDAKDAFAGYAQFRYELPGGEKSDWVTVRDKDLAVDLIYSHVGRKYRSDIRVVPERQVLDAVLRSLAVEHAGSRFRSLTQVAVEVKEESRVVESERFVPQDAPSVVGSAEKGEAVVPSLQFTVSDGSYAQRTFENATADDVDFTFQFAVDFNTPGERCTSKAAGDSVISIELPLAKGGLDLTPKSVKETVRHIVDSLPDEFVNGEPFGVNLAGNGAYTLGKNNIDQNSLDLFVTAVFLSLKERGVNVRTIRSGGQTGVDQCIGPVSTALSVPATVHAPKNWTFRGTDGKDIRDEKAFKERFEGNDCLSLIARSADLVPKKKNENQSKTTRKKSL